MSFENFVRTQVADQVLPADTEITITTAVGVFRNPPAAGRLTLTDSLDAPTVFEIIYYDGIVNNGNSTHTLQSVVRSLEGTAPGQAWPPGSIVLQTLTAAEAADFAQISVLAAQDGTYIINGGSF